MVTLRAAELAASGYLVIASHPWKSGRLAQYARELGINVPADAVVLRIPPPWAKTRDYLNAASVYQLQAMLEFGRIAHETAGQPLNVRLKTIRERLAGRTYGRTPKPRAPALPKIERLLAMRRGGAPAAAAQEEEIVL